MCQYKKQHFLSHETINEKAAFAILVQTRTDFKNRVHKIFERCSIKLSSALQDLFGPTGREVVQGIIDGRNIKEILDNTTNKTLKKRRLLIEHAVKGALSPNDVSLLRHMVEVIAKLDAEITSLESEIGALLKEDELEIASSIPGIGRKVAPSVIAEIGDVNRFENASKLASWAGLCPSVYQSSGLNLTGHITRQGSKYLRYMMVEAAHAVSRMKHGKLASFYQRIKMKKGGQVALVALARKMLTIIWHLLKNKEKYTEEDYEKKVKNIKAEYHTQNVTERDGSGTAKRRLRSHGTDVNRLDKRIFRADEWEAGTLSAVLHDRFFSTFLSKSARLASRFGAHPLTSSCIQDQPCNTATLSKG